MLERRQHARQRFEAIEYVELPPENGGFLLDLSECGAAVQVARAVSSGVPLDFWFSLGQHTRVHVRGQVVWTDRTGKAAGVRFIDVPQQSREQMQEWLTIHAGEQGFEWKIVGADTSTSGGFAETSPSDAIAAGQEFSAAPAAPQPETSAIPERFSALPSSSGVPGDVATAQLPRPADQATVAPVHGQTLGPLPARTSLLDSQPIGLLHPATPEPHERHARSKGLTQQMLQVEVLGGLAALVLVAISLFLLGRHLRFAAARTARSAAHSTGTSAPPQAPAMQAARPTQTAVPDTASQQPERDHAPVVSSRQSPPAPPPLDPHARSNTAASRSTSGIASLAGGAPKGSAETVTALWKAVEAGDTMAELSLADLYASGKGVRRNCAQARILIEAAARNGGLQARTKLQQLAARCP